MLHYKDHLKDTRVDCYSILFTTSIKHYINIIKDVYSEKGGIEGQRSALKTKSAQRIRKRLISDLVRGTVIPPIVLGVKLKDELFGKIEDYLPNDLMALFQIINDGDISIIDGMQRTTALIDALKESNFDGEREIRIELWVAKSTNSLIYRMLVLNSGQIPWSIKRQIEVVFTQLSKELEDNVNDLNLYKQDDSISRSKPGQFQASQFIELFMLFGTKRVSIDIQEELAEEFTRLDIIETSGNNNFTKFFFGASQLLVDFDKAFWKVSPNSSDINLVKFKSGRNIFSSQPARAGFIVALAQEIFGIPGIEFEESEQARRFDYLKSKLNAFLGRLTNMSPEEAFDIIDLPTLDEQINVRASKVGEFERNFFYRSFKTMMELAKNDSLTSLTPCWRSSH